MNDFSKLVRIKPTSGNVPARHWTDINSSQSRPPTPPTGFRQLYPSWSPRGSYASDLLSEASLKLADGAIWQCLQLLNRCIGTLGVILWSWIWKYFCMFLFVFLFFVIIEGAFSSHPVLRSQVAEPPLLSLYQTPGAKKSTKTQSQQDEAALAGSNSSVKSPTAFKGHRSAQRKMNTDDRYGCALMNDQLSRHGNRYS